MKNGKLLFVIEFVCVFILFLLTLRPEQLVYRVPGENICFEAGQYSSDSFVLQPGVYRVKAYFTAEHNQDISLEIVSNEAIPHKALLANGVTVFANNPYMDFEIYTTGNVNQASIACSSTEPVTDEILRLEIYRTAIGNRILLSIVLLGIAVGNALIVYRKKIVSGTINREKEVVFWGLIICSVICYIPFLTDYFSFGSDTAFHILRIEGIKESILNGDYFPIRIQSYVNFGHGSVVPALYNNFFLYIPAVLRLIGFPIMTAYKIFVLIVMLATAFITYYSLHVCVENRYAAFFGTILYMFIPYRIYNFYSRGAVGEYLGTTFLPLIFCGMHMLIYGDVESAKYKKYKWFITAGMLALLFSHLVTAELAAMYMGIVCVLHWKQIFRKNTIVQLVEATMTVLVLSAWAWGPMLYVFDRKEFFMGKEFGRSIQNNGHSLANFLQLVPNYGGHGNGELYDYEPVQLGIALTILILLFCISIYRMRGTLLISYCKNYILLTFLMAFLCTKFFPWDFLEKLPAVGSFVTTLQFPQRIMPFVSLSAIFFVTFYSMWIKEREYGKILVVLSVVAALLSASYYVDQVVTNENVIRIYTTENMGTTSTWNRNFIFNDMDISDFKYHLPAADAGVSYSEYFQRGITIGMKLQNMNAHTAFIELPLTGFKGYGVKGNVKSGDSLPYVCAERGAHGDLRLAIPAYFEGDIEVGYYGNGITKAFEWISVIGVVWICLRGKKICLKTK